MKSPVRELDSEILEEIVRSIVQAVQPDQILLFGSAARGEMGPDSDVDLLVVKGGRYNRVEDLGNIYRALPGTEAVDVIMVTPEDLERYRDSPALVIQPALKDGRVVYAAPAG